MSGSTQFVLQLGLAQRLLEVAVEALERLDRVGAEQRLQDEEAGDGVGRLGHPAARERAPVAAQLGLGQRADARAHVGRALGVVRGGDEQVARRSSLALAAWSSLDRDAEAARVAADLVEREQAQVAVEGGVLDRPWR